MKRNRKTGVFSAIREAAATHRLLSAGTILCAIASVLASLLPPLLLARVIDTLTGRPVAALHRGAAVLWQSRAGRRAFLRAGNPA